MSTPVVRQQKTRTRNARRGSRNRGSLPVTSSLGKLWDTLRRDVKYCVRQADSLPLEFSLQPAPLTVQKSGFIRMRVADNDHDRQRTQAEA